MRAAEHGCDAPGISDALDQYVDAVGASEQLAVEHVAGRNVERFGFVDDAIVLGARIVLHMALEIPGRTAD
ncbi:MAG TPA: hypothetical protein VGD96_04005 [Bradyrhizobium sp.]